MLEEKESFSWGECFESICNSALIPQVIDDFDADHPVHEFQAYWDGLADGDMPDNTQFSPVHVKSCLRWLMIFKETELGEEFDFQLTLLGTSASEMTIHAKQGQFLKEFTENACYQTRKAVMIDAIQAGKPAFARINMASNGEYKTNVMIGMFPFRENGGHKVYVIPCPENKKLRALM
ncbi:hypothetical protein [Kordiimonas sp. SCSIO 12610]|uniref:hypothetical protein n=1 Tax=Kordiimonas sp. SCSIO 12610 TaxID=2829597 RepID=UPI002108A109|nr:hypothetical protein [Kordiimonas sp. SCSIO 12610]UTW56628.1 hypothetical protein KFF44_06950 [Kordiimonas sp. SCSIO 12610]